MAGAVTEKPSGDAAAAAAATATADAAAGKVASKAAGKAAGEAAGKDKPTSKFDKDPYVNAAKDLGKIAGAGAMMGAAGSKPPAGAPVGQRGPNPLVTVALKEQAAADGMMVQKLKLGKKQILEGLQRAKKKQEYV